MLYRKMIRLKSFSDRIMPPTCARMLHPSRDPAPSDNTAGTAGGDSARWRIMHNLSTAGL